MAESPDPKPMTEYERRRQENIRRNQAILAELRRDAAAVSAAYAPARPKKQPRPNPISAGPAAAPRRSGRVRRQPLPSATAAGPLPSAHLKRRPDRFPISEAFVGEAATVADRSALLTSAIRAASWRAPEGKARAADGLDPCTERVLKLKPGNVRKLNPTVISAAPRVLPLVDRTVLAVGTNFGHLMFWDANSPAPVGLPPSCARADGMFWYHPHSIAVSGITAHPSVPLKIYSCSRNGEICLMDMEEEIFNMVYLCNDLVLSLCQSPDNSNCLYFGKGNGDLNAFDVRAGKISSIWQLHCDSISSIDFNPENTHMLATSSLDKTACVWDVRNMKMQKAQSLKVVEHKMRVHSAYFSPSGSILATTSHDNIGILSACDFDRSSYLQHWSPSTTFKASWGWSDSELFVGTERDIDILSVDISDNGISTSHKARIGSEHMADVPSQFATHPYQVGVLACAGHRNKLFLWTPQ